MKERARMKTFTANDLNLIRRAIGGEAPTVLNVIRRDYHFEVVTPMFGGGVEAGVNDKTKLIRETEIRGHLRFWWRATIGAQYTTSEKLFEAESRIWGNTNTPSKVVVRVSKVGKDRNDHDCRPTETSYSSLKDRFGYVLFPFEANTKLGITEKSGLQNIHFTLTIIFSNQLDENQRNEVETAVWAWANFGGIGARTRRGVGTLFCEELAPSLPDGNVSLTSVLNSVRSSLPTGENFFDHRSGNRWPTLEDLYIKITGTSPNDPEVEVFLNPMDAWEDGVKTYRKFRQGTIGRNNSGYKWIKPQRDPAGRVINKGYYTTGGRFGRSYWPEPDAIRRIKDVHYSSDRDNHAHKHVPNKNLPLAFPRAELGAPIVFKFNDNQSNRNENTNRALDPAPSVLYPVSPWEMEDGRPVVENRMASPFTIKPIVFKGEKKAVSCVIFYNGIFKDNESRKVVLRQSANCSGTVGVGEATYDILDPSSSVYTNSPLRGRSRAGSALEGFKSYIQSEKYSK